MLVAILIDFFTTLLCSVLCFAHLKLLLTCVPTPQEVCTIASFYGSKTTTVYGAMTLVLGAVDTLRDPKIMHDGAGYCLLNQRRS